MSSAAHWRSVDLPSLLIEEWADGYTVFQPASGKTHFLNPLGMQLLFDLHAAPGHTAAEDDLCAGLAARLVLVPDASLRAHVRDTLQRFDELGLIESPAGGLRRAR